MRRLAALLAIAALVAGCSTDAPEPVGGEPAPATPSASETHGEAAAPAPPRRALRPGERRVTVAMPKPYTPKAPYDVGTDDYRCFLLDPGLAKDVFVTGTDVAPGNPSVVHHVILFRVPPDQVELAQQADDGDAGQGWTCFGGTGLGTRGGLDDAPWLAAWAPGASESVFGKGYGVPLPSGSRIVMQVHYNLLAGREPDVSATRLRVTPTSAGLTAVETMLLPAPVELPCRPEHDEARLCDRAAAVADVKERFGTGPGSVADWLRLLCPGSQPGPVQSCTRRVSEPTTVIGAAGHMHLLGRSITIEVNPGTDESQVVLDIPAWNFDDQRAVPVTPIELDTSDEVRVTCRHEQSPRDHLPAFEGQPDRYVLWGEGTTDEMCLGILQVTRG